MDNYATMHGGRVLTNSPQFPRTIPSTTLSTSNNPMNGPPGGLQGLSTQQMMQITGQMPHHYMHGHPHAGGGASVPIGMQQYGMGGMALMGGMPVMSQGQSNSLNHQNYGQNGLSMSGGYSMSNSGMNAPSPSSSPGAVKRSRKNLEKNQVEVLENAFMSERYPSKQAKELIAAQSGLDYSKVVKWFDNRRTKARKTTDSPYISDSPLNSPSQSHNNLGTRSPSPENSPASHRNSGSPMFQGNFNNQYPPGMLNNYVNASPGERRSGGVNAISAKMNNFSFTGVPEEEKKIKADIEAEFGARGSDRRGGRAKEESWEDCKEHRVYASQVSSYRTGVEIRDHVTADFESWLSWAIDKKKLRTDTFMLVNPDHFSTFKKEVYRLFEQIEFYGETETVQGDSITMYGNTITTSIAFVKNNQAERDINSRVDPFERSNNEKGSVSIECLQETRTIARTNAQSSLRRVTLKVTPSAKFDEKPEPFVIGLKTWGAPDNVEQGINMSSGFESWGNLDRLQQALETTLKHTELLAFIFFCCQIRTNQRWFKTVMRQSMFGDEDTDYYSEEE